MRYDPRVHGARCDNCPRRSQTPVPPEGPVGALYVWIGQDPGRQEVRQLRPFVGPTGSRIWRIWEDGFRTLNREVVPRREVFITNAALCMPITPREKEARDAVTCCRPRLLRELRAANPEAAVLMMGKNAWLSVTGQGKGVGKYIGFHVGVDLDKMEELVEGTKLPEAKDDDDIPF